VIEMDYKNFILDELAKEPFLARWQEEKIRKVLDKVFA